jgi:hypothetical protein
VLGLFTKDVVQETQLLCSTFSPEIAASTAKRD